jgi:S-adenosylmethionine hydrolase
MVYSREKHKCRHVTAEKYFIQPVSRTFHGRDIFAPSAAHLAAGATPASFGKLVNDCTQLSSIHPTRQSRTSWTGTVLHVDRFGNLITNFHADEFEDIRKGPFEISVGLQRVTRLALTFADCEPGELFAIIGSSGYIEVALNQSSAAKHLGCGPGAPVDVVFF